MHSCRAAATALAATALAFAATPAYGQNTTHHAIELSAIGRYTTNGSFYTIDANRASFLQIRRQVFGGGLLGYSYALSPRLALEARAGYLFGRQPQVDQTGGEQILAHVGLRGSQPIGHSRYSFQARIAPGVSSFSSAVRSRDYTLVQLGPAFYTFTSVPHFDRITHFSLEETVGIAARLSPTTSLHIDFGDESVLAGDRRQVLPQTSPDFPYVAEKASVEDHSIVTVGLSHSFGRALAMSEPSPRRDASDAPPSSELIVSYALQPTVHLYEHDLGLDAGVAFTGSHFLRSWLALDSSVILLHGGDTATFQDGGSQLQFFAGLKAGLRRPRYGLYAKLRPGVVNFSHAFINTGGVPPPTGSLDQFGMDAGGVIEWYPKKPLVLRLDLGETLIHFAAVTPVTGYGTNYAAAGGVSTPQFLVGAGWRF